ncbi:hypothetical protein IFR09_26585 [Pseudomonas syringae]|nr:hypothetical protein [Pseudomonas syringae]MBD8577617.1 hypothetical protein [Pseudomonas syringae]MBD8792302.1 hypothetical protein [Pseudomonas syringae]MBD8803563.1 hypothetical protein [Pseudomonas syringae]MBD8814736.1 hypothetical protein [Pseudomonas syringae]
MSTFYSIAWKPMHEPALLPADPAKVPPVFFSIAWQAPLRPLYYPADAAHLHLIQPMKAGPRG